MAWWVIAEQQFFSIKKSGYKQSKLSGFVCAYHPAAPGSSPKHTIYAFSFIVFVLYLSFEKNKNKQKEAGFGHFFNKASYV